MRYNPDIHHRRSVRLREYDYRGAGAYFITICAFQRECLFGEVVKGELVLNAVGTVMAECWQSIPVHFPHVVLDAFVIMPNHCRAILHLTGSNITGLTVGAKQGSSASPGSDGNFGNKTGNSGKGGNKGEAGESLASPLPRGTGCGSLAAVVQNIKSVSTRKINKMRDNPGCPVWQRSYYEHVIRNERDLENVRRYIVENPLKWDQDENNPANMK